MDAGDPQAVERAVAEVLGRFGRIDVLVNTVGGYRAGTPVHETPLETWDFMLNLNARTAFVVSRAVIPVMLEQGRGKIVNIAASVANKGSANSAAYSASKSAVARLTESMAEEVQAPGDQRQRRAAGYHRHTAEPPGHAASRHQPLGAAAGAGARDPVPGFRRRQPDPRRTDPGLWEEVRPGITGDKFNFLLG